MKCNLYFKIDFIFVCEVYISNFFLILLVFKIILLIRY